MRCWRCGREFYSQNWNQTLCDDCLWGRNPTTTVPFNQPINNYQKIFSQTILLVEDGSVDTVKLDELGIQYLVYKKGSQKPELINIFDCYKNRE